MVVAVASATACAGHPTKTNLAPPAAPASLFPAEQAWLQPLAAPAEAPPSADRSRVYLPVAEHILAFDRATGEPSWTADIATHSSLALIAGSIYALTEDSIVELDATSGATRRRIPLPSAPTAGMAWTADTIVVPVASDLVAWRITEGRQLWTRSVASPVHVPPAIGGNTLFVALDDSRISALQMSDGTERWTTTIGGIPRRLTVTEELAVVSSSDRFVYALETRTGGFAWARPAALDVVGTLIDSRRVYVVSLDNTVRAYDHDGAQKWKKVLDTRVTAEPRMTANGILLTGADSLILLGVDQAGILGTYSLPELAVVTMPPVVFADAGAEQVETIVLMQDGLLALRRKPPPPDELIESDAKPPADFTPATDPAPSTATPAATLPATSR